jgi:hypothetical protein
MRYGLTPPTPPKPELVWVWGGFGPTIEKENQHTVNANIATEKPVTEPKTSSEGSVSVVPPPEQKTTKRRSPPSQQHKEVVRQLLEKPSRDVLKNVDIKDLSKIVSSIQIPKFSEQHAADNDRLKQEIVAMYKQYEQLNTKIREQRTNINRCFYKKELLLQEGKVDQEMLRDFTSILELRQMDIALDRPVTILDKTATRDQVLKEFDSLLEQQKAPLSEFTVRKLEKAIATIRLRKLLVHAKIRVNQLERDVDRIQQELDQHERILPTSEQKLHILQEYEKAKTLFLLAQDEDHLVYNRYLLQSLDSHNIYNEKHIASLLCLLHGIAVYGVTKHTEYWVDPAYETLTVRLKHYTQLLAEAREQVESYELEKLKWSY